MKRTAYLICLSISFLSFALLFALSYPYEHWWQYLGLSISIAGFLGMWAYGPPPSASK